ncbi:MAG: DUF1795 domain-containing protein [Ruminococcaceae bacterium]|nr:DUF1795 domain-containing protein [Oscillospiraceae bacterium]
MKITPLSRLLCALLALCLLAGGLVSCASTSEVPDGYQYATCDGEYFRFFVPTQWTVNTESGISSAYIVSSQNAAVSMVQIPFTVDESKETSPIQQFKEAHVAEISKLDGYEQEKYFEEGLEDQRSVDMTYKATVVIDSEGENKPESRRYRQVLIYRVREQRFFLFTYSAPADKFDTWLDIVDGILACITYETFPYEGEHERKVPDNVTAPEGMKLVSDNEVAYRFFAPESWIRDVNNGQNLVYASEEDRSNVSMLSYDIGEDATYTVEKYWELCRQQYEASLENFTLISETDLKLHNGGKGEKDAKVYEYTYTLGGTSYHVRQTICLVGMIYTMTYTALPEQYEAHLDDVKAMEQALYFRTFFD